MESIAGLILLGGTSRRFGRPKHLAPLGGVPFLIHAIDNMAAQSAPLLLATGAAAVPPELAPAGEMVCVGDDPYQGAGPLAGIRAGLAWLHRQADAPGWLFSAPVDVPFLPRDLAPALCEAARSAGCASAYAATGTQHHAAIAVWHRRALAVIDELLAAGPGPVMAAHERLGGVRVERDDEDAFFNVNTPEDYLRACRLIAAATEN